VSAALVAVRVTLPPGGTVEGEVYKPALETVPSVEFPPASPFTLQVTAVLVVPFTVAVNCCVFDTGTDAVAGDRLTEIPTVIVTVA
jgi:hypothetical protein